MRDMELLLVLVESKDGGRSKLPMTVEVERLDKYITDLSTATDTGQILKFSDVQSSRGSINFLFYAFKWGLEMQEENVHSNHSIDETIRLDFPSTSIFGHEFSVGSHFFRPTMYNDSEPRPTRIQSVETIALWYMLQTHSPEEPRYLQQIELSLFEAGKADNFSDAFTFHMYADKVAGYEMVEGSRRTLNLLAVGMALMIAFMSIALRDFGWRAQLMLVPSAILSPFLAMGATFGLMGWVGMQYNSVMAITPFLILGIGVDDAFLMLHSWRRHSPLVKDPAERMEVVVREVGPSVSITSITNMLAFTVGILSPSPTMSSFCTCTAIAVFMDFVLEFAFFGPTMVLSAKISKKPTEIVQVVQHRPTTWNTYSRFVISKWGKVACFVVMTVMYTFAYFGVQQMETTFEPQKTFPMDSRLQDSLRVIDRIYNQYHPISFIVNHPPDESNATEVHEFLAMVDELEAMPGVYGPNQTQLWLRDYLRAEHGSLEAVRDTNATLAKPISFHKVPDFLSDHMMEDKNIVLYHEDNGTVVLDSFVFVIVSYGERDWHERAHFIESLRDLVDRYSRFNVTVFDFDSTIFDLILSVKPEMIKAVLLTLASMTCVCFLIVPNVVDTGIAILAVLSISYSQFLCLQPSTCQVWILALLGSLGLWGQELDPVTLVNVLMAIGFSVDFSSHICYHYYKLGKKDTGRSPHDDEWAVERLSKVLDGVGRPMIEATLSTIVCMLPLFFISIYMVASFAKTVICVCVLGVFHGLFVVPVLLSLSIPCCSGQKDRARPSSSTSSDRTMVTMEDAVESEPMIAN
ncbi:CRE-PTR-13 protein [Aphelenchoides avenae]|nr:CRE-PTR-13 protein [Aphelenchus avenae]